MFFLLRRLKLTNFRTVIAVTKYCETVIFLLKFIIPTKFHTGTCLIASESLALHLRVKLTWAEQSMFRNMWERAYCIHSSLCWTELQYERYLKLELLFPALHAELRTKLCTILVIMSWNSLHKNINTWCLWINTVSPCKIPLPQPLVYGTSLYIVAQSQ